MFLAAIAASGACSADDADGMDGTDSPAGTTDARCVGQPVEAYVMRDSQSCLRQGSQWNDAQDQCRGTTFRVHCSRADESGLPTETVKGQCLDMPGCGWTEDDGTVTRPSGRCEGTKTPCAQLDASRCEQQTGCIHHATGCESSNSAIWLNNVDCGYLQIADNVSYSVVKTACERALGCAWVP